MIGAGYSTPARSPHLKAHWFNGLLDNAFCRDHSGNGHHLTTPYSSYPINVVGPDNLKGWLGPQTSNTGLIHKMDPTYDGLHISKEGRSFIYYGEFKFDTTVPASGAAMLFSCGGTNTVMFNGGAGFMCRLVGATSIFQLDMYNRDNGAGNHQKSATTFTAADTWYKYAVVYDGATKRVGFYINTGSGWALDATVNFAAWPTASGSPVPSAQTTYWFSLNANGINSSAAQDGSTAPTALRRRNEQIYWIDDAAGFDAAAKTAILNTYLPWLDANPGKEIPAEVWP